MWTSVALLCWVSGAAASLFQVQIGGLFHPENRQHHDVSFKNAVDRINMDNSVLPGSTLMPIFINVSTTDSLTTGRRVCSLVEEGIAAIFGPHSETTAGIVQGISDVVEIPNIGTHWDPAPGPSRFYLNLHPEPQALARATAAVLTHILHWKSFVILYEKDEGLIRLQEVLKARVPSDSPITVRQLEPGGDNRPLLKEIHMNLEVHVFLDCEVENVLEYLRQAKQVKMFGEYISYYITSLDAHTVDYSEFRDTSVNITALRLVDPERVAVRNAVEDWKHGEKRAGKRLRVEPKTLRTETALVYDAVNLFAKSLHQLNSNQRIGIRKMSCTGGERWRHGLALHNYMKLMQVNGMTGPVKLDDDGRRTDFELDIVELRRDEFIKIGRWNPTEGAVSTRTSQDIQKQISQDLRNKTFIVTSRLGKPYLWLKTPTEGRVGNDRYEGYAFDLIEKIAEMVSFKFLFYVKDEQTYPGIINDLLDKRADLAICDLTITLEREKLVDFTNPFMELGISILYTKPTIHDPSFFSFLDPLSSEVWLFMATAYLGITILLYMLARASPTEWSSPHPCLKDPDTLTNNLTMTNCLWHNVGSLMQQGSDIAPQAVSTRAVVAAWWFFILIMISSYIANLAASLTVTRLDATIESVDDLAQQTKIKYGTVRTGSTRSFFEKSKHPTYSRIWTAMESTRPGVFVKDNSEGLERVKKNPMSYAFFMESTQIEYFTARNCNLTKIGGQLDSKGYGIGLPLDSPYRTLINNAILQLQENGWLRDLKNRWWKEKYGGGACSTEETVKKDTTELGMPNVGGVFFVLLVGSIAAVLVGILEMLWNCRKIAVEEMITPSEALMLELKFAANLSETKPVRKKHNVDLDRRDPSVPASRIPSASNLDTVGS